MRGKIIEAEGSVQNIPELPAELKALYKTVWEIPQKAMIDMAAQRQTFICQSQSLNLFQESPTLGKLSSMYMYAWKQGVKTTYYLRSRAKTSIGKTTVTSNESKAAAAVVAAAAVTAAAAVVDEEAVIACSLENPESCEACQ